MASIWLSWLPSNNYRFLLWKDGKTKKNKKKNILLGISIFIRIFVH